MKNWDKEIDQQIKESLETVEFAFEDSSWDKMDNLLNQNTKPKTFINSWKIFTVSAISFLFITSLYFANSMKERNYSVTSSNDQIQNSNLTISINSSNLCDIQDYPSGKLTSIISKVYLDNNGSSNDRKKLKPTFHQQTIITKNNQTIGNGSAFSSSTNSPIISSLDKNHSYQEIHETDDYGNLISISNKKQENLSLGAYSLLTIGSQFLGNLKLIDLEKNKINEKEIVKLSKEERKKLRNDAREIRQLLGKNRPKSKILSTGKFSPIPTNYGIKVGYGVNPFYSFPIDIKQGVLFGLFLQYPLKNKLSLQFDLNYHKRTNLDYFLFNSSFDTPNATQYSLILTADNIKFYEFQSVLQFNISPKHIVELGLSTALVRANVASNLNLQQPSDINLIPQNLLNLPNPVANFSYSAVIGYEYQFNNKFSLNARYHGGLNRLFRRDLPGRKTTNTIENGSTFQLALKFNIGGFKKSGD